MGVQVFEGAEVQNVTQDDFGSFGRSLNGARISQESIKSANKLLERAFKGDRRARQDVREAFSTSDFTLAAFATIDKEMREIYQEFPSVWREYTSTTLVKDFRPKYIVDMLRGQIGLEVVPELTEYPTMTSTATSWSITARKFGARFAASWEAWINDDAIDEIQDWPAIFAKAAAETDAIAAVSNLVTAAGINTAFFKTANGNAPTSLPLTIANLDTVLAAIPQRKTAQGRPIYLSGQRLVVPPALENTAKRILAAKEIRTTTGDTEVVYDNYLAGSVQLVVDPYLTVVNLGANANTTWFLLPDPNGVRKSVYVSHLRGHESADIRWKADQGTRAGGGSIPVGEGSFEIDDLQVRVRHVVGNGTADPLPTYASAGA